MKSRCLERAFLSNKIVQRTRAEVLEHCNGLISRARNGIAKCDAMFVESREVAKPDFRLRVLRGVVHTCIVAGAAANRFEISGADTFLRTALELADCAIDEIQHITSYELTGAENWLITVSYCSLLIGTDSSAVLDMAMLRHWKGEVAARKRIAGVLPAWDGFLLELIRTGKVSVDAEAFIRQIEEERIQPIYARLFRQYSELMTAIGNGDEVVAVKLADKMSSDFAKRKSELGDTTLGGERMSEVLTDIRLASVLERMPTGMRERLSPQTKEHVWHHT